ncbi:MAG: hypothetical protein M3Q65_05055, partial [Chloroflexota bacterium]|nr:hypothetical protein [Chloroflexota bacterium]
MTTAALSVEIVLYGFALWLGLYLIGRDPRGPRLRLTGLGLVAYALALACDILGNHIVAPETARAVGGVQWALLALPALCWAGAMIDLLPEEAALRAPLARGWRLGFLPAAALFALLGLGGGTGRLLAAAVILPPLLVGLSLLWRALRPPGTSRRSRRAVGVLLVATLFFTLSTGLLVVPLGWLPRLWTLLLIGPDLVLLGTAIAALDAFDQGEALLPDIARSATVALFVAVLFGGQVALVMALGAGPSVPLLSLLLATIATAIATQIFADQLGTVLDAVVFNRLPRLRRARAELRATASALPRLDPALDLATMDEAEFARLTRRAFSHFGDLPRLAASPLTCLPLVEARLAARGAMGDGDDALERAAELKALLAESIARLKPRAGADFGTSDEWRYYNALYFPYVAGLKPYSRRAGPEGLDPAARAALEWFRAAVPERTLYNWQTAAAKLVARDLRAASLRAGAGRG